MDCWGAQAACYLSGYDNHVLPDITDMASCAALSTAEWSSWYGYGYGPLDCGNHSAVLDASAALSVCPDGLGGGSSCETCYAAVNWAERYDPTDSCSQPWVCVGNFSSGHAPYEECGTHADGYSLYADEQGNCCDNTGPDPSWDCPTQPTCALVHYTSEEDDVVTGCSNEGALFDNFARGARSAELTCGADGTLVHKEYLMDDCAGDAVTPEYSGEWEESESQAEYEAVYNGFGVGDCLTVEGGAKKVESIVGVCSEPEAPTKTSGATLSAATLTVPVLAAAALAALVAGPVTR